MTTIVSLRELRQQPDLESITKKSMLRAMIEKTPIYPSMKFTWVESYVTYEGLEVGLSQATHKAYRLFMEVL